jgi:Potential Queuosine, Q, salvage protein family
MPNPCSLARETTEWVMSQATHVTIIDEVLSKLFDQESIPGLESGQLVDLYTVKSFDKDLHFADLSRPDLVINYLLVVDCLNFCFWPDSSLEYADLAGGIKQTVLENPEAISPQSLSMIDGKGVQKLMKWPRAVPAAAERARLLRELGEVLIEDFDGKVSELFSRANHSAEKLVSLLTSHFPGFRDHAIYKGRQIFFYKRAQIFCGDLYGAFHGEITNAWSLEGIAFLTMFADYRVPAVLREMGVLQYSDSLSQKIDSKKEIMPGSEEEIEIRAATIVAVEKMREIVAAKTGLGSPPAVHLDWWLWEYGEAMRTEHRPHHRTRTIYY